MNRWREITQRLRMVVPRVGTIRMGCNPTVPA